MKGITFPGLAIAAIFTLSLTSCNNQKSTENMETKKGITKAAFGNADGQEVFLYTLTNSKGTTVKISTYGGVITSWVARDKNNSTSSIVLGFDSLGGYLAKPPYFGALVGLSLIHI